MLTIDTRRDDSDHDAFSDPSAAPVVPAPDLHASPTPPPPEVVGLRLAPNAAITFRDFTISDAAVGRIARRYLEIAADPHDPESAPALHHVELDDTGTLRHPITDEICNASECYLVSGAAALTASADQWLPLPYMRLTVDSDYTVTPTEGPSNWVRVKIVRDDAISGWRVALAFDTTVADQADRAFVMPTQADIAQQTVFAFSDQVEHIAWLLTEAWVDDWLKVSINVEALRATSIGTTDLQHLAVYLTLLTVLADAVDMPDAQFSNPASMAHARVDLILDLGAKRTAALLVRHAAPRDSALETTKLKATTAFAREPSTPSISPRPTFASLPIRDLGKPWRVTHRPFPSQLTFAQADFGPPSLSRSSGRLSAFAWPSLARIGNEAETLANNGTDANRARTNCSSVMRSAWDCSRAVKPWRFATPSSAHTADPALVTGQFLAGLTAEGEIEPEALSKSTVVRPWFSNSALISFYAAEIALQAVTALASSTLVWSSVDQRQNVHHRLHSIVLTLPAAAPDVEAQLIKTRVETGVQQLWRAMGWLPDDASRPVPSVLIGSDSATAAELFYISHEIENRFQGRTHDYLALMGKDRIIPGQAILQRALRIATVDMGAATTSLAIHTWSADDKGACVAVETLRDGFRRGGEGVASALVDALLIPIIRARLSALSLSDLDGALSRILGLTARSGETDASALAFNARFVQHIGAPFAEALLALNQRLKRASEELPGGLSLLKFIGIEHASAARTLDELDRRAALEGAGDLGAGTLIINVLHRDVVRVLHASVQPLLAPVAQVVRASDCDLLLLTGRMMTLPALEDMVAQLSPVRPDRIVALPTHRFGHLPQLPGLQNHTAHIDNKVLAVLGQAVVLNPTASTVTTPRYQLVTDVVTDATIHIGHASVDGRLTSEDILFTVSPNPRHRLADEAKRPIATLTFERRSQRTILLSSRRLALEAWPASPHTAVTLEDGLLASVRAYPVRVTIELVQRPSPGRHDTRQPTLRVTKVRDGVGTALAPSEVTVTLQSSPAVARTHSLNARSTNTSPSPALAESV